MRLSPLIILSLLMLLAFELSAQLSPQELEQRKFDKLTGNGPPSRGQRAGDPEQDCNGAFSVCQQTYHQATAFSGHGDDQEVPTSSCLGDREKNSAWYSLNIESSGTLEFTLAPIDQNDDYDFALYNVTNLNCSDILSGVASEVRCNYCVDPGNTGLSSQGSNNSEGCCDSPCRWSNILNVNAGESYRLVVSNYSSSQSGYDLTFGGTAIVFDSTVAIPSLTTTPCGANFLTLQMSESVLCDSITATGSEFNITGPGGPFSITGATGGIDCPKTSQITINFSPPLTIGGNYTLTINNGTDGNTLIDGCGNSTPPGTLLNFTATPPPGTITGPTEICMGSTATLAASSGTAYIWSNGDTTQSINVSPTVVPAAYSVTITNGSCNVTASHTITTIKASPLAGFSFLPNPPCVGQSIQFTSTSTPRTGCGGASFLPCTNSSGCFGLTCDPVIDTYYFWEFGDGATDFPLNNNPTHTYNSPGTYDVSLTIGEFLYDCTNKFTMTITIGAGSGSLSVYGDTTICQGLSTIIGANGIGAYSWTSNPVGFTSTDSVVTINPTSTTTYTVTAPGCSSTYIDSVTVTVSPPFSISVTPPADTICGGGSVSITASGANTYIWTPATGLDTTAGPTVLASPTNTTTYTVTGLNVGNCEGTGTATITVGTNVMPTITPNGPTTFCTGGSVILDAGAGYTSYLWSDGSSTQTIAATQAGNYTVTVTDNNGCSGISQAVTVTVGTNLVPIITGANTLCSGNSIILDAGAGYTSYLWSDGSSTQTITISQADTFTVFVTDQSACTGSSAPFIVTVGSNPSPLITGNDTICDGGSTILDAGSGFSDYLWSDSSTSQTITVTQAGTYTVTVTDTNGCTGSSPPSIITVTAALTPIIIGPNSFCIGNSVDLDGGAGYIAYLWSDGSTSQTITVTQSGTFTVTVTDNNGCTGASSPFTITAGTSLNPVIVATGSVNLCAGDTVILDAGNGFATYSWSEGSASQTITVSQADDYIVTVSDGNGCTGSDTITITVSPQIIANAGIDIEICIGDTTELSASGGAAYLWRPAAGLNDSTIANPTTSPQSNTDYIVSIGDSFCFDTDTVRVSVNPLPLITVSNDTTINIGESTQLFTEGGTTYFWAPNTGLSQTAVSNPVASPKETTTYIVEVIDSNGCINLDTVIITVIANGHIDIPTGFTPNGDGINDIFGVLGNIDLINQLDLKVFNRWGQLVFESKNPSQGWDGTYKNKPQEIGTYVYLANVLYTDGTIDDLKGNVTLIR